MTDVALVWDASALGGDLRLAGADLALDATLASAVVVSLLSDRRVPAGELPPGETDRRGWWGDSVADADGDRIGSRLWLIGREKVTPAIVPRAEAYAREALEWLVEDGHVEHVDVAAAVEAGPALVIRVAIGRELVEVAV